jgi:hypothetical protein
MHGWRFATATGREQQMGTRVEALARRFEAASDEVIALVTSCDDEQWRAICQDEGWSVGRTAEHIAAGMLFEVDVVLRVASGRAPRAVTMDMIHAGNADSARERPNPDRAATLRLLHDNRDRAAAILRKLRDDQLDNRAPVPFIDNRVLSAEELIEHVLIGHIAGHMAGMQTAVGA